MISLNSVASLLKVIQSNELKTAATLSRLLDVEVLQSLGENRYLLNVDGKELTALSQRKLTPFEHYFAKFEISKANAQPTLSHLLKIPKIFIKLPLLENSDLFFEPKELAKILGSKETMLNFKETLLKELANAPSKENFQALTPFLLSMHQNILSIPFRFYDTFALLQFKKRYNKKTKKSFLDFYAFFSHLGPISGLVMDREIKINVAFEETKEHLMQHADELGYKLHIEVNDSIAPLYEAKEERVLDIVT